MSFLSGFASPWVLILSAAAIVSSTDQKGHNMSTQKKNIGEQNLETNSK